MIYLIVQMAPPTRNNSRAHARKDNIIARLHVRIASLQQRIPRPNNTPRDKSTVTCYECGVTGHYSNKCPMKAANTASRTGSNAVPLTTGDESTVTCYECGIKGHYSNECPQKLMKAANNAAPPAQQQRRFAAGRKPAPGNPNHRHGRFNSMRATEALEALATALSMFSC